MGTVHNMLGGRQAHAQGMSQNLMNQALQLYMGNLSKLNPQMQTAIQQMLQQSQAGIRGAQADRGMFTSGAGMAQEATMMPQIYQQILGGLGGQVAGLAKGYAGLAGGSSPLSGLLGSQGIGGLAGSLGSGLEALGPMVSSGLSGLAGLFGGGAAAGGADALGALSALGFAAL